MKNLLTVFLLFFSVGTYAQVEKGMFLATGNISFQKNDYGESLQAFGSAVNVTQIDLSPSVAYMVSPRLAIGLFGSYSKMESKASAITPFSASHVVRQSAGGGVLTRYYLPITEKFYFFAQGDVGYAKYETSQTVGSNPQFTTKDNFTTVKVAVRPGISYFIVKRLAVEIILGSVSYTATNASGEDLSGFSFRLLTRGVSPGVTFTF